jgi:two-component system, OmpR family, response regulator
VADAVTWICIVDEDAEVRDVLTEALRDAGYGVRSFDDGADALEAIETALEAPRLAIVEVILPGLTGKQLVQRVREGRRVPKLPVLVITGADVDERYFAPWAILGVVRKPISMDMLLEKVAAALPRRKRRKVPGKHKKTTGDG